MAAADASSQRLAVLCTWMHAHGVEWEADKLDFRSHSSGGAGVFAKKALSAGQAVCRMPKAAMLTPRTSPLAEMFVEKKARSRMCE